MRYLFLGVMLAVLVALISASSPTEAAGGHGACDGGVVSIGGSADLVTYDASPDTVTGVCVKAGNTSQHDYYTADVNTGCYAIRGVGTSVVTVTRLGEGRECQGISHIDVTTSTPTSTPTPTPSATPTPAPSPTPTTTPTSTPTLTLTPTSETPGGTSVGQAPISLPNTGAGTVGDEEAQG